MNRGETKSEENKVLSKRQVAAILYGAHEMRESAYPSQRMAFDAFLLMYILGLRLGEAVLLRYSHVGVVNKHGMICSVRVPTEKKVRYLPAAKGAKSVGESLDPLAALYEVPVLDHNDLVARAFDSRTRRGAASISPWLFPSPRNPDNPISGRMLDYVFREARDRGGVPDVYSSHALRHTSASELAGSLDRRGRGESAVEAWVGKFLRHSPRVMMNGNRVTRTYIHLAPKTLEEWAPLMRVGVLTLPPLAPVGPSRFDATKRYGQP